MRTIDNEALAIIAELLKEHGISYHVTDFGELLVGKLVIYNHRGTEVIIAEAIIEWPPIKNYEDYRSWAFELADPTSLGSIMALIEKPPSPKG